MTSSRASDRSAALTLLFVGVVLGVAWLADQPVWLRIVAIISVATVGASSWVLWGKWTDCNVARSTRPGGCQNRVRGKWRSCHRHRGKKLELFLSRTLGRPPSAAPPLPRSRLAASEVAPVDQGAERWWVEGPAYRATMLGCTVVGSVAGTVSAAITIYSVVNLA